MLLARNTHKAKCLGSVGIIVKEHIFGTKELCGTDDSSPGVCLLNSLFPSILGSSPFGGVVWASVRRGNVDQMVHLHLCTEFCDGFCDVYIDVFKRIVFLEANVGE